MSKAPHQFVQGGCELNSHPLEELQANPCLLAWTVMDGLVPPGDPREDLAGLLPPSAASSTCAGLCQPGQSRHRLLVSKKAEQSRSDQAAFPGSGASSPCFACPQLAAGSFVWRGNPTKSPSKEGCRELGTPSAP